MISRRPPAQFSIERRPIMGAPGGSYDAAKAERQGRAGSPNPPRPVLAFVQAGMAIEVRLGVVTVAVISPNPANLGRAEYIFRCLLPPSRPAPDPAATLAAAKTAIRNRVADWFDATGDHLRARVLREARG